MCSDQKQECLKFQRSIVSRGSIVIHVCFWQVEIWRLAGVIMQEKNKIQKVNNALLYRSEVIKWVDSIIDENKSFIQVEQELSKLRSKMGYVLVHTLVSRLSDEDAKVRNVSSWCLGLLRDPRAVKPLLKLIQSTQTKEHVKAAAVAGLLELGEEFDITAVSPRYIDSIMKEMTDYFMVLIEDEAACEWAVDEFVSLPPHVQLQMIDYFGGFCNESVGRFIAEVCQEHMYLSNEVNREARKLLYKLKSAGVDTKGLDNMQYQKSLVFYTAMASCTRDDGGISLFIAWEKPNGMLRVVLFVIEFAGGGLTDCTVVHEMTREEFNTGLCTVPEGECNELTFVNLTLEQAKFLLYEGYDINISEGIEEPSDFRKFKWLLEDDIALTETDIDLLIHSLIVRSDMAETVVAAFYLGFSHFDFSLVYSLLGAECSGRNCLSRDEFRARMEDELIRERVCYHGFKINDHRQNGDSYIINAECVISVAQNYYRVDETFCLIKECSLWKIAEHERTKYEQLSLETAVNILDEDGDKTGYMRASFRVDDYQRAYEILDSLDSVELVEDAEDMTSFLWIHGNDNDTNIWGFIELSECVLTVIVHGALRLDVLLCTLERELGDSIEFDRVELVDLEDSRSRIIGINAFRHCYETSGEDDD